MEFLGALIMLTLLFIPVGEAPPAGPVLHEEIFPIEISLEVVREEIIKQATEVSFDVNLALLLADCESDFVYNVKNKYSSAKGVYQFTDPTWKWIKAEGHQYDYQENIKQFLKYYPKYPGWWKECNIILDI